MSAGPRSLDLRLVPLAMAAWAGTWAGVTGAPAAVAGVVGLTVFAAWRAAVRRSARWAAAALILVVALGLGGLQTARVAGGPVAELAAGRAVVSAVLVTTGDPAVTPAREIRPERLLVRARLLSVEGRGRVWSVRTPILVSVAGQWVSGWRGVPLGTRFAVQGRLQPVEAASGAAALLTVQGRYRVVAPPGPGLRLADRVRGGLREAVAHRGSDVRGLVPALVLGDTSGLPPELVTDFRTTGLTHLTAVSGANLTLLIAFLLFAARWSGVRGWWLRLVAVAGVLAFVGLCRTEPSVLRAAAMGLVALAALGAGGARAGPRNLSVAVLALLLADPSLARSYGFALSVMASGGIIWWSPRWVTVLRGWLPAVVAEAVAVPLAAQLATMPLVAQLSGSISMVGLLANALAGPFVGPATVLGFAAAGLSLLSRDLAALAGMGAAWSAQPIIWIAQAGAQLPGASLSWPATSAGVAWLVLAAAAAGALAAPVLARRWLVIVLALALVAVLARPSVQPGWPPKGWVFVACEVGQGDGLVVRVAERQALLVDTGPDPPAVLRCLDQLGITNIPLMVLTHFHADHVGAVKEVLRRQGVGMIWVSPLDSPPGPAAEVRRAAAARGVRLVTPAVGTAGTLGSLSWEVLGPRALRPPAAGGEASELDNDASLVVRIETQGVRLLLTGDVEPPGQRDLLAAGVDLGADVLKIPHHGSAHQEPAFFAATGARFAVASAGPDNDYGHPAPRTLALAGSLGMTVRRTVVSGSVAIVRRGAGLVAVAQRAAPRP